MNLQEKVKNLDLTLETPKDFMEWLPKDRLWLYTEKLGALRKKWLEYPLKRRIVKKQANYIKAAIQKLKKEHFIKKNELEEKVKQIFK